MDSRFRGNDTYRNFIGKKKGSANASFVEIEDDRIIAQIIWLPFPDRNGSE